MVIKKLSYRSKNPNFSLEKDLQGKWVVSNLVLKGEKRGEEKKKKKNWGKANERSCSIESSHDCDDR